MEVHPRSSSMAAARPTGAMAAPLLALLLEATVAPVPRLGGLMAVRRTTRVGSAARSGCIAACLRGRHHCRVVRFGMQAVLLCQNRGAASLLPCIQPSVALLSPRRRVRRCTWRWLWRPRRWRWVRRATCQSLRCSSPAAAAAPAGQSLRRAARGAVPRVWPWCGWLGPCMVGPAGLVKCWTLCPPRPAAPPWVRLMLHRPCCRPSYWLCSCAPAPALAMIQHQALHTSPCSCTQRGCAAHHAHQRAQQLPEPVDHQGTRHTEERHPQVRRGLYASLGQGGIRGVRSESMQSKHFG